MVASMVQNRWRIVQRSAPNYAMQIKFLNSRAIQKACAAPTAAIQPSPWRIASAANERCRDVARCDGRQTTKGIATTMAKVDNMKAARGTYDSFIAMAKWGTIACAIIAAIVVMIIA